MVLDPGQLRHKVRIQQATETNTAGEVSVSWRTVATRFAKIDQGSGREFFMAQQVNADMTHMATFRTYGSLTTKHRLLWSACGGSTRTLHIDSITDPDSLGEWQQVQCREVV